MWRRKQMTIRPELLDELLKDYQTPQDLFGEDGLLKQLTKGMIERCLQAEMQEHLGYPKHGRKKPESTNTRNGSGQKTLKSEHGELQISVPRDRDGSFEPILVKKPPTSEVYSVALHDALPNRPHCPSEARPPPP